MQVRLTSDNAKKIKQLAAMRLSTAPKQVNAIVSEYFSTQKKRTK